MSAIQVLFQQAQLAEATYSNLSGINSSTISTILQSRLVNLQPDGSYDLSLSQATAFTDPKVPADPKVPEWISF
jgi:hypothetical protein